MINQVGSINSLNVKNLAEKKDDVSKSNFSDFLKKAIYDANDAKKYQEELTNKLISGELKNLHELSIARGVANVKFQALTEGVSKVVEAYKEITRIQI